MPELTNGIGVLKRMVTIANRETFVVYSSLPRLYLCQTPPADTADRASVPYLVVPNDVDVQVWADTVCLLGTVKARGRNVSLHTRQLSVLSDSEIDVSGAPHDAQVAGKQKAFTEPAHSGVESGGYHAAEDGTPGRAGGELGETDNGADGRSAGTVVLTYGSVEPRPFPPPRLFVNHSGGDGQHGQRGANGQAGGSGGAGYDSGANLGAHYYPGKPGQGGDGAPGGRGGRGGNGGRFEIYTSSGQVEHMSLDVRRDCGRGGHGGAGGEGGSGGRRPELLLPDPIGFYGKHVIAKEAWAPNGQHGADGAPGEDGSHGVNSFNVNLSAAWMLLAWDPVHLDMLLQRAKQELVNASTNTASVAPQTIELLRWLQGILGGVNDPTAHQQLEARGGAGLIEAMAKEAGNLVSRFDSGRDAFGKSETYAPFEKLSYLEEHIAEDIDALERLEAAYREVAASFEAGDVKVAQLGEAYRQKNTTVARAKGAIDLAMGKLDALEAHVRQAKAECRQAVEEMGHVVTRESLDHIRARFNVSADQFGRAMEMIFFVPPVEAHGAATAMKASPAGIAMTGLQVGTLAYESLTTVQDSQGRRVAKDLLIGRLVHANEDVMNKALGELASSPGEEESTKVIASLEQLDALADEFPEAGETFRRAVRKVLKKFEEKNRLVFSYNTIVAQIADLTAMKQAAESSAAQALHEAATVQPSGLHPLVGFFGSFVRRQRSELVERLSRADRALRVWSLNPNRNVFANAFSAQDPGSANDISWGTNAAVLRTVHQTLRSEIDDSIRQHSSNPQCFGEGGDGATLRITDPTLLAEFKDRRRTSFEVVADAPRDSDQFVCSDFSGLFEIRLSEVSVRLEGARSVTHDGVEARTHINILHGQTDDFFVRSGSGKSKRSFMYDRLDPVGFIYTPGREKEEPFMRARFDTVSSAERRDSYYASRGPFTRWTLEIPKAAHGNTDLSDLTAITISFRGQSRV